MRALKVTNYAGQEVELVEPSAKAARPAPRCDPRRARPFPARRRRVEGLSVTRVPQWTGFARKTLWDWLQLLIVPAILIGVTFVWSATQTRSDNRREDRRIAADRAAAEEARQAATLQSYLDQMSGLMLREKLLTTTSGVVSAVAVVARTVTLTTLRRLDGARRAAVLRFLYEARLIDDQTAVVSLREADLRGADLTQAQLEFANLEFANLEGAKFTNAYLPRTIFEGANLQGAVLRGADLTQANLFGANLRDADLEGALLDGAALYSARGLDLNHFITDLPPERLKAFLGTQKVFLDSLSPVQLSKFNLTPEKLARFRREASGG